MTDKNSRVVKSVDISLVHILLLDCLTNKLGWIAVSW